MADVTYNSLHFYQLQNYKLDGYAWLTVVEINDRSVKDQRKIIFPVLYIFTLFQKKKKILPSFPSFFLSQSKCKPRNPRSVTSGPHDTTYHQWLFLSLLGDGELLLAV